MLFHWMMLLTQHWSFCYELAQPIVLFLNCWLWEAISRKRDPWKIEFEKRKGMGDVGENEERHK